MGPEILIEGSIMRGPLINFHYEGSLTVSLYVGCKVRLAIFVFCLVVLATSGLRYILM